MTEWRKHGLLAFTLHLQGGSPEGYSYGQVVKGFVILAAVAADKMGSRQK